MQIWPAIDLRDGRCVRLEQGDYSRETVFGDDPVKTARQWIEQGASCLHLVDLDGARDGRTTNLPVIREIVSSVEVACEVGGGIRDEDSIRAMVDGGVDRVVIGTKALQDPGWFAAMCKLFDRRIVLGLDARNGFVATDGWLKTSTVSAIDLAARYSAYPIAAIVYTDIARDGMLSGPNFDAMKQMKSAVGVPVVASGGVSSVSDVSELARLGLDGCIVGRALYEGRFTLPEILAASRSVVAESSH
jgi:phosphoribosylformimino-5-aminoimidazole carboxamide ribotide isomerase